MPIRMASNVASFVLVCALALCGCDSGNSSATTPDVETVKQLLLDVSERGEIGSASMIIRDELEKLKATDEAKANELIKDLEQLENTPDPTQVKTMAKKMADKL